MSRHGHKRSNADHLAARRCSTSISPLPSPSGGPSFGAAPTPGITSSDSRYIDYLPHFPGVLPCSTLSTTFHAPSLSSIQAIDSLINFETVKYYNGEEFEIKRYKERIKDFQLYGWRSSASLNLLNVIQSFVIVFGRTTKPSARPPFDRCCSATHTHTKTATS
jgi:hypothetical protein